MTDTRHYRSTAFWLAIGCGGLALGWWLDQNIAAGLGALVVTLAIGLGGVVVRLSRIGRTAATCVTGPRLGPLQVSSLALIALGVQCFHAAESGGALPALLPILGEPLLAPICIGAGVGGLAILSLFSTCRDEALSRGEPS